MHSFLVVMFYCLVIKMAHTRTYTNTPCSLQEEIPKAVGEPLFMGEDSSPYRFYILNLDGRSVKNFDDQIYILILNGTKFFRRFLIQARVATDSGMILTSIRAGEFLNDTDDWKRQGIKMLDCPSVDNDAITQENDRKKLSIEAQWIAKRTDAPIQIFVSIQQDAKVDWIHLAPKSGFIFPDVADEVKEITVSSDEMAEIDMNSTTVKPKLETEKEIKDKNSKPYFGPQVYFIVDKNHKMNNKEMDRKKNALKDIQAVNDCGFCLEIDYCSSSPCLNHGLCVSIPNEYTFECYCTDEWSGDDCMTRNHCLSHPCMNLGTCINDEHSFTCECLPGWAGPLCQDPCPSYLCKNGGTCVINSDQGYSCSCPPEFTGRLCESEFEYCASNPCLNGGTCSEEMDKFECECPRGYMGDKCQRPCQDILLGCEFYDENDFCNSLNQNVSLHFQTNCAFTCGKCTTDISKIKTSTPLPMTLEPLQMLLGTWYMDVQNINTRYPMDFLDSAQGYTEKIEFLRPFASPFDGSSISFRTIARNKHDSNDIALNSGFIYLKSVEKVKQISMITIGNDGLALIEEGKMSEQQNFQLNSRYFLVHPLMTNKIPMKIKRKFSWNEYKLEINIEKILINGQFQNATLVFRKENSNLVLY